MLIQFITARLDRQPCGECGYLQCSAWAALDDGQTFEQWSTAVLSINPRSMNTLKKQYRLAEVDRNACLVDDGESHNQTKWGTRLLESKS